VRKIVAAVVPKAQPCNKDWLESLLESLPQRKPKDSPEFITWLESLPQCKPEGHPDRIEWELSLSGIPFDERMKDLKEGKEYKEKFGDCNVSKYQEGYEPLGSWVNNIRQAKKHLGQKKQKGDMNLTDDMIDSLNGIGFEWNLQKNSNDWFSELKEYKKKFGDCIVSSRNTDYKSLAGWVANMRNARKGKVNSKLTGEMIDGLNGIGFYWGKGQSAELSDAKKGNLA